VRISLSKSALHGLTENRLSQIQHFIRECDLIPSAMEHSGPSSPSPTLSDDWELVSTPAQSANLASSAPSDPDQMEEYNEKPLPSIPVPKAPSKSAKIQKGRTSSTTDRLGLTCVHGPNAADAHEVQTSLKSIPDGLPPINRFAGDEQAHEKLALALASHLAPSAEQQESDEEVILPMSWRRAADTMRGKAYYKSKRPAVRPKKGMNDKPNGNWSSRSRKRKPEESADEQNRQEQKKMSPSSSPTPTPPAKA
jgi:hypothetical protein